VSDTSSSELETLSETLDAVEAAMARLDAGTYGLCEGCGTGLPNDVLEADVTASFCASCTQARLDG